MTKMRYVGPIDEVELREFGIVAKRNHQVEIPEGIAETLLDQADWEEVGKKKEPPPPPETEG